jgi:hypothetical protein
VAIYWVLGMSLRATQIALSAPGIRYLTDYLKESRKMACTHWQRASNRRC